MEIMEEKLLTTKNYKWIYTYDYAPDSVWEEWRKDVYGDGTGQPLWIAREADAVAERVGRIRSPQTLQFILLTDSHYTLNGTWDDTVASLYEVSRRVKPDGIIHLGDLTDGMLPVDGTEELERKVIGDLKSIGVPVFLMPGNHDYNYFHGNPQIRYPQRAQYYVDYPEHKLRMMFLDSFDPKEQLRYGFTEYCIHWVESVLDLMPEDYRVLIFSHVPPIKQLHAWSDWIRNSHILMPVLDRYADRIIAFINGHSHCDHLFNELKNGQFPVISINCAKCEYFLEHKPEGAKVPFRRLGDRTQESFDIMQVDAAEREIYFTRFGAGRDRMVKGKKAMWK